jgi:membrane-associated phospholipid phosphatase
MPKKNVEDLNDAAEALQEADATVTDAALPYRETAPVKALSWLSEIGDQPQMRMLCGAVMAAGLARGDMRLVGTGAKMLAAHQLATSAKNFVKQRVDRTRPRSRSDEDDHKIKPGTDQSKEETSFPSGHSAGATAVAHAFARDYPEYAAAAYGAGGLVALAQIPRCAHYPTDVGAGIAIGLASAEAVDSTARLASRALPDD